MYVKLIAIFLCEQYLCFVIFVLLSALSLRVGFPRKKELPFVAVVVVIVVVVVVTAAAVVVVVVVIIVFPE